MEEGVYLLKVELENIRCFNKKAILELKNKKGVWERWTIVIGDNGTGKTTLLRCISGLEQKPHQYPKIDNDIYRDMQDSSLANQEFIVPKFLIERYNFNGLSRLDFEDANINAITTLGSNSGEADILVKHITGNVYSNRSKDSRYLNLLIYGYGANRFMSRKSFSESKPENLATLFDDEAKLINAEAWISDIENKSRNDIEKSSIAIARRDVILDLLKEIFPTGEILNLRFENHYQNKFVVGIEFQTPYGWVTIHQLSLGYKTMVAWMVDLAARLFERYPDSDNPLAEPAIVLVDEIDLHMHPQWQRKIFDYLSEKFPKTQFIVTAHSPLIVQSAPKDANIVLLRREGDHVVIDNDIKSVHNWRIDQILNSDLFGNISQLPPDEEKWMDEREELLKKENLTKEEQEWLDELNEKADKLPAADNQRDNEAMEIIRKAAAYLKTQTA